MEQKSSVGLIGCGNIGRILAEHQNACTIDFAYDSDTERLHAFAERFGVVECRDFREFVSLDADIIVEAASVAAARAYLPKILAAGKHVLVMSTGALADEAFRSSVLSLATEAGVKIHIPSGAVMGLDNICVSPAGRGDVLRLKTTKPPQSLGIFSPVSTCIFSGKASECIRLYPKNSNVSVSLSLAAGRDIDVELWADPFVERITHEIFLSGEFGDAYIRVGNRPCPGNPATSYLAALSALAILENLNNPLVLGV